MAYFVHWCAARVACLCEYGVWSLDAAGGAVKLLSIVANFSYSSVAAAFAFSNALISSSLLITALKAARTKSEADVALERNLRVKAEAEAAKLKADLKAKKIADNLNAMPLSVNGASIVEEADLSGSIVPGLIASTKRWLILPFRCVTKTIGVPRRSALLRAKISSL